MTKKRVLALLLTLVMLLGMLPMSVLAADMSWTWTVTVFGDNYYRSDGVRTSTNRYTTNKSLDNSKDNEIGYKFEWNANAGGSTYDGGWQLCITVNGSVVERTTAYIYSRDMSTASGSWTAPGSSHTGNSTHPFTLYLSNYPEADYRYDKDFKLIYDANGGENAPATQTETSKDDSCTFTISDKEPTREGYTFLGRADGPDATSASYQPGDKITVSGTKTIYAVWEEKTPDPGPGPEPDAPSKPGAEDFDTTDLVTVRCTTNEEHQAETYGLLEGAYQIGDVTKEGDTYTCTVTVTADKYVDAYTGTYGDHTLSGDSEKTFDLIWDAENEQWKPESGVTFYVECEKEEEKYVVNVVIYRNGDFDHAYKTVALDSQPKDTIIDLTKLDIADYYTANYTGKYEFHGWFNDGAWNEYKRWLSKAKTERVNRDCQDPLSHLR